jgi:hypothetical protein
MKYVVLICLVVMLCSFQEDAHLKLRIQNHSGEMFKKLEVNLLGAHYIFTDLKAGKSTKPIRVKGAYRYCYAKLITEQDTLVLQPEDFVGETLHTKGKLTMKFIIKVQKGKRFLVIE